MTSKDRTRGEVLIPWLHLTLSGFVMIGLTIHLSGSHFLDLLSSDHLYPHLFVKDWLAGEYPVDAWKFGSATFLFPDYPIYGLLLVALGDSGITFPVFAVINMVLLGTAFGFAFLRLGGIEGPIAFAAGYGLLGLILAMQFLPLHELGLYWLLLPGFHGSTVVVGLGLCVVLIDGYCRNQLLGAGGKALVVAVGILGVYSSVLLFTQYLAPWLLTMVVLNSFGEEDRSGMVWQQIRLVLAVLAGALLLRFVLMALNVWEYGVLFRHFPYPGAVWACFVDFISELKGETGHRLWAFLGLYLLLIPITWIGLGAGRRRLPSSGWPVLGVFVVFSVLSGIVLPIVSLYWNGFVASRYFLNLLVLPPLALGVWGLAHDGVRSRFKRWPGLIAAALGAVAVTGILSLSPLSAERFHFNTPDRVAEFDRMVAENGLSLGLSGYWYSHLYNELGNSNAFLNHVRDDGTPFFWCNNVYWYYGPRHSEAQTPLVFPDYDFVLMNGLDEAAIREHYGDPVKVSRGVFNTIFIYRGRNEGIRETIAPEVAAWLDGKMLEGSAD